MPFFDRRTCFNWRARFSWPTCRSLVAASILTLYGLAAGQWPIQASDTGSKSQKVFTGEGVLNSINSLALKEHWKKLPIGELMGKIAQQFVDTPYVASTLDRDVDHEYCTADLTGLDCVTFFESTLDLARVLKKGGSSPDDFMRQLTYSRYRGGVVGDYSSRLHYTSDWLADNEKKGVVKILTFPKSQPFPQKVHFMSSNPQKYAQLNAHPQLIPKMKKWEEAINKRPITFVPRNDLAATESLLKTGDIVGICTTIDGIDISHTGLVLRDEQGVAHFVDASSRAGVMKVVIEPGPISATLTRSPKTTGAMFARPVEP